MKALLRLWLALVLAAVLGGGAAHAALPARPAGAILDQANLLPPAEEAALEEKLRAYSMSTGRAVMVATVASLDGQDIESFGPALGRAWGVGGASTDQGLILLVAPNERKLRIEVGYGLEEFMPDALASRIVRDTIVPRFKANDYAGGIAAGIDAILAQLNRDPADAKAVAEAAEAARANASGGDGEAGGFIFWVIMILFFIMIFGRNKRRGYRRSGIDPGIVLWGISEIAHHATRGGGGSFGGGGGSDWGGFGGGDFGGGGASGDW